MKSDHYFYGLLFFIVLSTLPLSGCAGFLDELSEFGRVEWERKCQPESAMAKGVEDALKGGKFDATEFTALCPTSMKQQAVEKYTQGYLSGNSIFQKTPVHKRKSQKRPYRCTLMVPGRIFRETGDSKTIAIEKVRSACYKVVRPNLEPLYQCEEQPIACEPE